jgi:two-component system OmpR family sensor kinase
VSSFLTESRLPRLGRRSLTARIVTGVVGLVVVLVLAIGSATYFALRSFLLDRLDQQLSSTAAHNASYFATCISDPLNPTCDSAPGTEPEWISLILADRREQIRVNGQYFHTLQLTTDEVEDFVEEPNRTISTAQGGAHLIVTSRPMGANALLVTGLSTADFGRTMRRLLYVELFIGGAAVLLSVLATSWGVQRSLRNLYQVTGTAREVAAELSPEGRGLDRRVPVAEEGTEVGQLAESMNTLLGAVETQFAARLESEQRMRQFLADASHELRTPLTSIRGYAELARMQRAAGETSEDNLARIESEGTRMSRLVEDLLLLARGDADQDGRVTARDAVDVAMMIDDVATNARAAFPDRRIDVEVTGSPIVIGDRDQLLRAVSNLVTNSAVHTAEGRPILIRAGVVRDGAPGVVIEVLDGGPGLPPEEAAHVFERFWRADKARSRARGGTGLGMAIVATIVRAHGGTVRFDSTVEDGSTVTIRLPADPPR